MITTGFSPELLRRDADPSPSDDTHRKKKRAEGLFLFVSCFDCRQAPIEGERHQKTLMLDVGSQSGQDQRRRVNSQRLRGH